ncbi:unnamed protein product [Orchesella dallaii]|uniref:CHAD domain-containing protein n=1 Tax=Orchesella dallaii TaxID=48710 RepID=A0ABP1QEX4_9HEXA
MLKVKDYRPEPFSKSMFQEMRDLQALLHLERLHHEIRLPREDNAMRKHFLNIISDIVEIQNSVHDLLPNLHRFQKSIQDQVFSYAQNYISYSKRYKAYRYTALHSGNRNFCTRTFATLLDVALPLPCRKRRKQDEQKIHETLQQFYHINGISFKLYAKQLASRCSGLEKRLSKLRRQIRSLSSYPREGGEMNLIDGLAFQLGVNREQMRRWIHDIEFICRQIRAMRRTISNLPQHACWEVSIKFFVNHLNVNDIKTHLGL